MHDRDILFDITRRMVAHHLAGTTQLADDVYRNPVSVYTDVARWERERQVLFAETPLLAALSCELRSPGDHKLFDAAGVEVIVVRRDDGGVGAFLNACRHRGARVVQASGCSRRLTCPYHAWTYDLDGTLVGLPGAEGFESVDRAAHGLVPVPVEERHGTIWVLASPEADLVLDAHLGGLSDELASLQLGELNHLDTRVLSTRSNWHLAMDTNGESYHFPYLHAGSIGPFTMGNLNVVDAFGPHQRLGFAACTLPELAEQPEDEWQPDAHIQLVYLIFPNQSLLVTGDHCELFQITPGASVDSSMTRQSYYARGPLDTDDERFMASAQFDMFHGVVRDEDFPCTEEMQVALGTGANTHYTFGRNEPALQHLHRAYEEALR